MLVICCFTGGEFWRLYHDQKCKNKNYFVLETTQTNIIFSSKAAAIFAYKSKNTTIAGRQSSSSSMASIRSIIGPWIALGCLLLLHSKDDKKKSSVDSQMSPNKILYFTTTMYDIARGLAVFVALLEETSNVFQNADESK